MLSFRQTRERNKVVDIYLRCFVMENEGKCQQPNFFHTHVSKKIPFDGLFWVRLKYNGNSDPLQP